MGEKSTTKHASGEGYKVTGEEDGFVANHARDYLISEPRVNACCPTDCTGLIPRPPQTEEERTSYQEIYQFEPRTVSCKDE